MTDSDRPPTYFVVVLERGPAWDWSVPMRRQQQWTEHAAFVDGLAESGFIVAGGPLGHEDRASRILHIVRAAERKSVESRLAEDPWMASQMLMTVSIEPWTILLGSVRESRGPS